jgi:hemerythrin-like domain-containing protein
MAETNPRDTLALETRTGLPDALRALLAEYPREAWEADPNFHGLVSFWLERHMMFRRLVELLRDDSEKALDGNADPTRYAGRVSRYGAMLVGELHGHHTIEDVHYFPLLSRREPRIERGFEILDQDHKALDLHLARFTEGANALIEGRETPAAAFRDATGAFRTEVSRLKGLLDRHLTDEEELVVPVILRHGTKGLG